MPAWTEDQLKPIVREILAGLVPNDDARVSARPTANPAAVISSNDVMRARQSGVLCVGHDAVVTPLARDAAERYGVKIQIASADHRSQQASASKVKIEAGGQACFLSRRSSVAMASDHGGFELKTKLIRLVQSLGLRVDDCGTYDKQSCDYPDFALAASQRIALGQSECAIIIDGAGIGSCMAANKVPGVLAATVHNVATAKNSREHNGANALCLGSGQMTESQACDIVEAWLTTPFGGGRHGRRVDKIRGIEQCFVKQI